MTLPPPALQQCPHGYLFHLVLDPLAIELAGLPISIWWSYVSLW